MLARNFSGSTKRKTKPDSDSDGEPYSPKIAAIAIAIVRCMLFIISFSSEIHICVFLFMVSRSKMRTICMYIWYKYLSKYTSLRFSAGHRFVRGFSKKKSDIVRSSARHRTVSRRSPSKSEDSNFKRNRPVPSSVWKRRSGAGRVPSGSRPMSLDP